MPQETNKKSRTREALLAGARDLISQGKPVTVAAAAASQGISRATAYRYFSDPAVLSAEAGLDVELIPYEDVVRGQKTPRTRALAVTKYIFKVTLENEPQFRQFLARNLDAWVSNPSQERRGARRVKMFNAALEGANLKPADQKRLVAALSAANGVEALVGLLDVASIDEKLAQRVVMDIANALLDQFGVTE